MEIGNTPRPTEKYRFRKQNRRNIEVMYRTRPGKWRSTGTKNPQEAIAFAERNLYAVSPLTRETTLAVYARNFFTPDCPWLSRMRPTGHTYGQGAILRHRRILIGYILPRFGTLMLPAINRRDIDLWLRNIGEKRTKRNLSTETKNKILTTFRHILDQAEWDGLVKRNEANLAQTYKVTDAKQALPFEQDEYIRFFPAKQERMLEIWGGPFWSTFFLTLATTGARPGQIAALRWNNWFPDLEGMWSYESVEHLSGNIKGLKTEKKGVRALPLVLTRRANNELKHWRTLSDHRENDDLIFHWEGKSRITLQSATILKHLRSSAKRAGVEIGNRTTYSWRHSYATDMLEYLDRPTAQEMLGHRKGSKITETYDHRSAAIKIRAIRERTQFAVERRFA